MTWKCRTGSAARLSQRPATERGASRTWTCSAAAKRLCRTRARWSGRFLLRLTPRTPLSRTTSLFYFANKFVHSFLSFTVFIILLLFIFYPFRSGIYNEPKCSTWVRILNIFHLLSNSFWLCEINKPFPNLFINSSTNLDHGIFTKFMLNW